MSITSTISVIIPTWNRAGTVVAAVQGVLAQTLPPLEVLVCDDGSSDDSEAVVRAIADPRVKWIAGPRGGRPAIPRNRGIALAKGEWLAFLDSDDIWLPEKLERQMEVLKASGHKACCTDAWRILPGKSEFKPLLGGEDHVIDFDNLLVNNTVICSSVVVHRSLFEKAEGFPEAANLKAIEDYALWLRILCLTKFDYLSTPLLNYLDDPAHSIRAEDLGRWGQRVNIMRNLAQWAQRTEFEAADDVVRKAHHEFCAASLQHKVSPLRRLCKSILSLFSKDDAS